MKTIDAAKFEEQCLTLLDDLDPDGLVITRRGKPVARLLPFERPHAELIGSLRHAVKVRGDILSTGVEWDACAESRHPFPRLRRRFDPVAAARCPEPSKRRRFPRRGRQDLPREGGGRPSLPTS